ncbi:MAG: ABC transporter substrate-binding protein [Hyphomicrobiales bacterium]|nr:ABC transporter substrate-binding protein [Hyphomicrobiales bacterium]
MVDLIRRLPVLSRRAFVGALAAAPAFARSSRAHATGRIGPGIAMHGEPALPPDFAALPYANPDAPKGGRLSLAFQGAFDSLNPYNLRAGSTAQGLAGNVYQSLMTRSLDEPFTLYGMIAQSVETDEDRSFVTFRLHPQARFSDGAPLTAADVLFTFDLLKTKGRPQQRIAYGLVRRIEALDDHTIRYDLTGADDRELPLTLGFMPVLAKHRTDVGRFADSSLDIPVASGPYTIASIKPGEELTLKRNPEFWARDLPVCRGLYNFDEIVISYYRDANSMFESFKAGLVDYREETNSTRWTTGYAFPAVLDGRVVREQLKIGTPRGMEGFAFNTRRDLFKDVRVREALAIMFDFEWINRNLFSGLYTRTTSFFDNSDLASTGTPASPAERALLQAYPGVVRDDVMEGRWRPFVTDGSGRDREQARQALALMEKAGWSIERGKLEKDDELFEFEIMTVDRNQERLALNYASSLRRIGAIAHVRTVDEVQYQRRRQRFDFDMMIGSWIASASPGNEQRMRWGSASANQEASFNLAGASSPAIDALIAAMLAAKTREDFVTAVRAYDRVLLSGFYIVPLYHTAYQWDAYWTKLGRPTVLPRWSAPLFGATLETWWRKPT